MKYTIDALPIAFFGSNRTFLENSIMFHNDNTFAQDVDRITKRIITHAAPVYDALMEIFHERRNAGDPSALDFNLGVANARGELGSDGGPQAAAPIKYVRYPKFHVQKNHCFLEHMSFLSGKKVYEIGVGPGYLFLLLKELVGCKIYGCDIDVETMEVYRRIRNSLGIQELVREHRITYNQDLGIESNTEAVIAFWTVFCKKWDVAEHEWFLNECRRQLVGEKVVILRFNNEGYLDRPSVKDYYDRISEQPLIDDPNFRVVRLA